jgi:hypothetical protein
LSFGLVALTWCVPVGKSKRGEGNTMETERWIFDDNSESTDVRTEADTHEQFFAFDDCII